MTQYSSQAGLSEPGARESTLTLSKHLQLTDCSINSPSARMLTSYEEDVLKSASAGDPQSQFALALLYEYGSEIFVRNPEQSIFWLEKAGHEAVAGACLYLGMKYEYGNRVEKDLSKAACWYSCAARQDWPAAQFFLAGLYEHGKGVVSSPHTALAWFGLAAEYGYPGAEEAFSRLLKVTAYESMEELSKKQEMLLQEVGTVCQ